VRHLPRYTVRHKNLQSYHISSLFLDQLSIHRRNPSQFSSSFVRLFRAVWRWQQGRSSLAWHSPHRRGSAGLSTQQARNKPNEDNFSSLNPVAWLVLRRAFLKARHAHSIREPHKPTRNFRACSCHVRLRQKFPAARARSASCRDNRARVFGSYMIHTQRELCHRRGRPVRWAGC
jgi:hypothetical protein